MIRYHNRVSNRVENEKVYGSKWVELAYKNLIGFFLTRLFFVHPWFSKIMVWLKTPKAALPVSNHSLSNIKFRWKIMSPRNSNLLMSFLFVNSRQGKRNFNPSEKVFCAGAEARYLAFENISANTRVKVKGIEVSISELFGTTKEAHALAQEFDGGTVIIARLCPVDYHRYHFPCDGEVVAQYRVEGLLHSVNPVALAAHPEIFLINERQVCIFKNPSFGNVAMIEVGALGVGKIIQSYQKTNFVGTKFVKGAEKGYFLFGGSTVIWVLKKGTITLAHDLFANSTNAKEILETWIPLGDTLGEFRSDISRT